VSLSSVIDDASAIDGNEVQYQRKDQEKSWPARNRYGRLPDEIHMRYRYKDRIDEIERPHLPR
jgi:hypothetical protein